MENINISTDGGGWGTAAAVGHNSTINNSHTSVNAHESTTFPHLYGFFLLSFPDLSTLTLVRLLFCHPIALRVRHSSVNELTRSYAASLNCVSYAKNPRRTRPPHSRPQTRLDVATRGAWIAAGWGTLAGPLGVNRWHRENWWRL